MNRKEKITFSSVAPRTGKAGSFGANSGENPDSPPNPHRGNISPPRRRDVADKDTISRILKEGESETIEFKEAFNREAIETVCAFANTKGGALIIGVSDKGNIIGAPITNGALKDWANQIDQGTGLQPSFEKMTKRNKSIALINVDESENKPIMFRGRAYRRVGSTTRQMNIEELTRLIMENAGTTWDEMLEPRADLSEIDQIKVKSFIRMVNDIGRRPIPKGISTRQLLEKLDLIRKNKLTKAAILLFGKHPQRFCPQAVVKAGRFRSETFIVDDRELEGTLFDQVEGAMTYFRERLQTRFEMTGEPQRRVIWEYPLEALREAIINSVCHRDYRDNGHIQIRLYDDRLLVWNPGNLPDGLSIEMLIKDHRSIPRNRLIAKVFFYAGLIEQWGSGVSKMIQETKTLGLPEPIFEEKNGLRVIFKISPPVSPPVPPPIPPPVDLTDLESRILEEIIKNPKISRNQIAKTLKISLDTVKEYIKRLRDKQFVRRVGKTRSGIWEVMRKMKA